MKTPGRPTESDSAVHNFATQSIALPSEPVSPGMQLRRSRFELQRNAQLGGISVHCDPGFHARGIQTRIEEFLEIETYRGNTHFAIYFND